MTITEISLAKHWQRKTSLLMCFGLYCLAVYSSLCAEKKIQQPVGYVMNLMAKMWKLTLNATGMVRYGRLNFKGTMSIKGKVCKLNNVIVLCYVMLLNNDIQTG